MALELVGVRFLCLSLMAVTKSGIFCPGYSDCLCDAELGEKLFCLQDVHKRDDYKACRNLIRKNSKFLKTSDFPYFPTSAVATTTTTTTSSPPAPRTEAPRLTPEVRPANSFVQICEVCGVCEPCDGDKSATAAPARLEDCSCEKSPECQTCPPPLDIRDACTRHCKRLFPCSACPACKACETCPVCEAPKFFSSRIVCEVCEICENCEPCPVLSEPLPCVCPSADELCRKETMCDPPRVCEKCQPRAVCPPPPKLVVCEICKPEKECPPPAACPPFPKVEECVCKSCEAPACEKCQPRTLCPPPPEPVVCEICEPEKECPPTATCPPVTEVEECVCESCKEPDPCPESPSAEPPACSPSAAAARPPTPEAESRESSSSQEEERDSCDPFLVCRPCKLDDFVSKEPSSTDSPPEKSGEDVGEVNASIFAVGDREETYDRLEVPPPTPPSSANCSSLEGASLWKRLESDPDVFFAAVCAAAACAISSLGCGLFCYLWCRGLPRRYYSPDHSVESVVVLAASHRDQPVESSFRMSDLVRKELEEEAKSEESAPQQPTATSSPPPVDDGRTRKAFVPARPAPPSFERREFKAARSSFASVRADDEENKVVPLKVIGGTPEKKNTESSKETSV